MNRLRTRLILAFVGIILLVTILPLNFSFLGRFLGVLESDPAIVAIVDELPPESVARIEAFFLESIPRQIGRLIILGALVGTIAGLLISRTLTEPLNKLAEAAKSINFQNLGRRVEVRGTEEVVAVADAFNEMAERLEEAETLRRNLLADVAHELRTPVTVIQGNLRAILDDVYPLEKEEVARLYEQTRLLTRVIDDLRELAQAEASQLSLNITEVDVAALVKETAVSFQPIAKKQQVELHAELLGALPTLHADAARLRQSLHNLVDNALRYTPANGRILLDVEQVDETVQIRVRDSGQGMLPEQISHIFDRFYRADPSRSRESGGSGLGLAIVRAIAKAHGGTVTAVSPGLNQGSTFTLTLPVTTE
ncbi:sensor histidine kinase [Candidatus Leptofilum sp.]|uniref:sensor histidine kinase n=1 Tax=Candidatus Leptofilum sp. TaxID=3241576 RepID=UPI003B58E79E